MPDSYKEKKTDFKIDDEDGFEVYDWAFLIRALLKMQSKGVVQLEFISSSEL